MTNEGLTIAVKKAIPMDAAAQSFARRDGELAEIAKIGKLERCRNLHPADVGS